MKTPIQKLTSSKLFYNKWPYKVECRIPGANHINRNGLFTFGIHHSIDKNRLKQFASAVDPFLKRKDLQFRTEGSHFNLFCKDKNLLEELDTALNPWITKISGPTTDEELAFLLDNGPKKILCDKLPKDNFQYKIYFKCNVTVEKKKSFLDWSKKYPDKIVISPTSERWLLNSRKWVQDPFAYVKDEKTLSMVGLQLVGSVKRVELFIERKQALVA